MARYDDLSPHPVNWTNAKLMREARKYANLESFSVGHFDSEVSVTFNPGWIGQNGNTVRIDDFCREQTRLYRQSWLNPILHEIERRFCEDREGEVI